MTNAYGVVLDDASLRWAAAESVPETVIAAICLLETKSVDEIVARLTPIELGLTASAIFKVACAKLYDRKTPITAADLLNDRVLPLFEQHEVKLLRVLTDRGSEYCGNPERHEYELYLAVEDIDHSRTKTKSPQTNGICERFHKTVLNEFTVSFRKKVYRSIDELQTDLDLWVRDFNEQRPHQGRWCFGKTPMQTFLDAMPIAKEKMIAA
jgi:hypothetical protein